MILPVLTNWFTAALNGAKPGYFCWSVAVAVVSVGLPMRVSVEALTFEFERTCGLGLSAISMSRLSECT
ncbi:MAG: hypothetical protein ABI818_20220 [Acidobacteriota bacterium]